MLQEEFSILSKDDMKSDDPKFSLQYLRELIWASLSVSTVTIKGTPLFTKA
jgi:hypothetical protein